MNMRSSEEWNELVKQLEHTNSQLNSRLEKTEHELEILKQEHASIQELYAADMSERIKTEEKLTKEKEFSQKILECLPGIFYLYTYPQLRMVYWNKNHETLLGFTNEELQDRYIMDWHVPGNEHLVQKAVDLVMEKGANTLESPLLNKKGEYVPFLMTGIRFETPHQQYLMGFGIDISEQKKIEAAQQRSESLFRLLAENSTDMIARHNKNGEFIYVSPACKTMLGYNPEDLIGQSAFNFIHPDDMDGIQEDLHTIIDKKVAAISIFRLKNKKGDYVWLETISKAIFDNKGDFIEIHASSRDVTQRKLYEEKLNESEIKYSTLFGAMTEMVVTHELIFNKNGKPSDYRIIDCNRAYSEITGIKKDEAIGKLGSEIYQTEYPPYLKEFSVVAQTGIPYEYSTYFAPMDKHFMISVISPGKNKFATITTDITPIKQIQDTISEKNKELENYLYVASHDLRAPLVNIQGFSQRLQKLIEPLLQFVGNCQVNDPSKDLINKIIQEDIPRTLNFIFSNVTKMDALINGLLQISRTGRIKMTITKVDMNQLINSIVTGLSFQLSEISAKTEIEDLPACYGDAGQLNQLFSNIISNAIKYRHPDRPLMLHISARSKYNKVIYTLKDNGIGIAPRHQKRIWDVFYRVDSTLAMGEGLGLSIAKRICDKHKGKIWVESEECEGSIFFIELLNTQFEEIL